MNRIILLAFVVAVINGCTSKIEITLPPKTPIANETSDIIISEISTAINTDGNAGGVRNHYVELYNGTRENLDLSQYAIGYQASLDESTLLDWSFPTDATYLKLSGTLESAKCYVIASPQADPTAVPRDIVWGTESTAASDASSPLQLSGNSAIALLKKDASGTYILGSDTYSVIDAFGSPNVARVTSGGSNSSRNNFMWPTAGESTDTRNRTFWRKKTVFDPSADWALTSGTTADDSQWILSGDRAWDYSNVGQPTR
jgi:hypothetical protein